MIPSSSRCAAPQLINVARIDAAFQPFCLQRSHNLFQMGKGNTRLAADVEYLYVRYGELAWVKALSQGLNGP